MKSRAKRAHKTDLIRLKLEGYTVTRNTLYHPQLSVRWLVSGGPHRFSPHGFRSLRQAADVLLDGKGMKWYWVQSGNVWMPIR